MLYRVRRFACRKQEKQTKQDFLVSPMVGFYPNVISPFVQINDMWNCPVSNLFVAHVEIESHYGPGVGVLPRGLLRGPLRSSTIY